jgi:hypothetical protein
MTDFRDQTRAASMTEIRALGRPRVPKVSAVQRPFIDQARAY